VSVPRIHRANLCGVRPAAAAVACALLLLACGRDSAASDGAGLPRSCLAGTLGTPGGAARTLDRGSCLVPDGVRFADFRLPLSGGSAYLVIVSDRRDTTGRHRRHRRFDAELLSGGGNDRVLLRGTPYEGREPSRTISQLFFIAPDTAVYTLRVRGHEPTDRGAYAVSVQPCGGGSLRPGSTVSGVLDARSCLEQMSFGADSGHADLWRVHLSAGQRLRVRITARGRAPLYLRLSGPGLRGDEGTGDVDRLSFTASDGGEYTLLVGQTAFAPGPTPYTLRATRAGF
jgi:hypothetical protein